MEWPVATNGFSVFRSAIKSPALLAVADHWDEARGGGEMPSWGDIRPSCIAPHLTRVWSYKYDRITGEFTARLAGNQITQGFGVSFRGTPLRDIHPPHIFDLVQDCMTRVVLGPYLYRSSGKLFRQGDHVSEGERIILPLASDAKCCDGVLGASEYLLPPPAVRRRPVELILDKEAWFSLAR